MTGLFLFCAILEGLGSIALFIYSIVALVIGFNPFGVIAAILSTIFALSIGIQAIKDAECYFNFKELTEIIDKEEKNL